MPYFKTKDGCSIYYETRGFESSKPVAVFLNGTMQSTVYWKPLTVAFAGGFRILVYDARSQGRSDAGEEKLSLEGHARDLSALLNHLKIENSSLVGLSHGATVALAYAARSPESVDRLVLCGVGASQTCRAKMILRSWLEILKSAGLETMIRASLPVVFGENFLKQNEKMMGGIVKAMVRRNSQQALVAHLEAMTVYPPMSRIAQHVHGPSLVLSGSDDPFVSEPGARLLAEMCNGRHHRIPGIGHSIPAEAPESFNATVLRFLKNG